MIAFRRKKLVVLVSGGGSNLGAIIQGIKSSKINADISAVISSSPSAYALTRAKDNGIDSYVAKRSDFGSAEDRDGYIIDILSRYQPDYIITAGYLGIITKRLLNNYPNRIINIHPSLLPKHGGNGMYGIEPHKAAIASGDALSGATVHFVDEGTDTGPIIMQRSIAIEQSDTAESLQARVLEQVEHPLLVDCVAWVCDDKVSVNADGTVLIKDKV